MNVPPTNPSSRPAVRRVVGLAAAVACLAMVGACSSTPPSGYGAASPALAAQMAVDNAEERATVPVDTHATYLAVVTRMQEKDLWFASLAHIDALEQKHGSSPESIRLRADALRQTGRAADSTALYRKLVDTPLAAAGWRGLGLVAAGEGDYSRAAELLENARLRTPTDAVLLSDLGYAYLRAGRPDAARVPLMQAQQLQPDNPRMLGNLALFFLLQQEPRLADALMDERRMSETSRAAVRNEARRIQAGRAAGAADATGSTGEAAAPARATATTTATTTAIPVALPAALPVPLPSATSGRATADSDIDRPIALRPSAWPLASFRGSP